MTDIFHYWSNDIELDATGDILTVEGTTETNQRILRALMTAAPEYFFHASYGAGIGRHVGEAISSSNYSAIQADVKSIVSKDPDVSPTPKPTFSFISSPTGYLVVKINYTYRPTGQLQTFTFTVSK